MWTSQWITSSKRMWHLRKIYYVCIDWFGLFCINLLSIAWYLCVFQYSFFRSARVFEGLLFGTHVNTKYSAEKKMAWKELLILFSEERKKKQQRNIRKWFHLDFLTAHMIDDDLFKLIWLTCLRLIFICASMRIEMQKEMLTISS